MYSIKNLFSLKKISGKMVYSFCFTILVSLLVFSILSYSKISAILKSEAEKEIALIADQKISSIQSYLNSVKLTVNNLSYTPAVTDSMKGLCEGFKENRFKSEIYRQAVAGISSYLTSFNERNNFYDLFLISPDGTVLYTDMKESDLYTNLITGPYKNSGLASVFKTSKYFLSNGYSSFKYYEPSKEPAAFISAPIIKNGELLGVLAFQINVDEVKELSQDFKGLGHSGETVIAVKSNSGAMAVAPLRKIKDAAFNKNINFNSSGSNPVILSVNGYSGAGETVDYAGAPTISKWEYLPRFGLGIVVKIDSKEVFEPLKEIMLLYFKLSFAVILIAILISILLSLWLTKPVVKLKNGVKRVAEGRYDTVVDVKSKDELGDLSKSFNNMASLLYKQYLESNRQSVITEGLQKLNEILRKERDLNELCDRICSFVSEFTESKIANLYSVSGNKLLLSGTFAFYKVNGVEDEIDAGEGLAGQCVKEKKILAVDNIPANYLKINSATLNQTPYFLILVPFIYNDEVYGVLELGSFIKIEGEKKEFLRLISEPVAITIKNISNEITQQKLLNESQQLSEELRSQQENLKSSNRSLEEKTMKLQQTEEELRQQNEELQVGLEELENRAKQLEASENSLKKQNDELQVGLEELQEKSNLLDAEKKQLEAEKKKLGLI